MKTIPFNQLQVFLAVARRRSFSAAARELGVTRSAASQAVRQLEDQLRVVLLARTTRSVSPTDAGKRLVDATVHGLGEVVAALANAAAEPGEEVGRLRLTAPHMAVPFVINPVLPAFHERYPRIEVEVVVEDRFVDVVAEGYDAGVRLTEAIEHDMVQVRLTDPFRFVVVAAPRYLERRGIPQKPEDLLRHDCIVYRAQSTGTLYAWELERGRRAWRVPVRPTVSSNDVSVMLSLAESGAGLMYALEPEVREHLRTKRLQVVLEAYAPTVPGFFLYFPSRAQRSGPLRLFVEVARKLARRG
jgi:DNA-binding transcriptional LysR family regulator